MGTHYYDNQVKFELPWDFEYSTEYDDEGKESYHIKTGSYHNDDGEKSYKFSCGVATLEASDDQPITSLRDMLKDMIQSENKTRYLMFDGEPEVALVTQGVPVNLFGMSLPYYMLLAFVRVGNDKIISLTTIEMYKEEDEDENLAVFENMATVIRSMSVNEKKNDLRGKNAQALHAALKPCFNGEDSIDIGARLHDLLGESEEEVSYADQPLPEGVCASEDGYAVINNDWAVRLPDGWVFSAEEEHTSGRPFAAISREEYDESGRCPFAYSDNCFTVFRVAESDNNEYGLFSLVSAMTGSDTETVIDRPGLNVSYTCRHEGDTTYCQYVTVMTRQASYMIQLFYTDESLGEYGRIKKIEEILNTICFDYEVPYSERYQKDNGSTYKTARDKAIPAENQESNAVFSRAYPNDELYPHYNSLLNSPLKALGFLGANVVINSTGTEYSFESLRSMLNSFSSDPDDELSDEQRECLRRIVDANTVHYDLHEKAKTMQRLFHVDPSVFNRQHDRECELEHGLMHRAYMMSALRSFAWTLAAYCEESGETPASVDYSRLRDLIAYISSHNWLNYNGETHCSGLCGGSDLHVYFVPDSTSQADRRQLLAGGMSEEEEAKIREKFENFNIIRSQVRSLDALRRDLAYIYPAVEKIYNTLKASRNDREQLLGDEADILYAWCALALAAKEPFFTEDGPMNCWFDQEETEAEAEANRLQQEKATHDAWMAEYGSYLTHDPQISFSGKLFVFSGLATHADPKAHPIIQKVLDRGGEFRSRVSGLTDYLVIDPVFGGSSKLNTAIEQQKKGKPVQIILLKDLEAALDSSVGEITGSPAVKNKSDGNKLGFTPNTNEARVKIPKNDPRRLHPDECNIDSNGVLLSYYGDKTDIVLPDCVTVIGADPFLYDNDIKSVVIPESVTVIEAYAFRDCEKLTKIHIPAGVTRIGESAFQGCKSLTEIELPESVTVIEDYAFNDCEKLIKIHIPAGVTRIGESAFEGCKSLTEIELPESVTVIEDYAFNDCEKLTKINIPSNVRTIGAFSFAYCSCLNHIAIPEGVISIGDFAFSHCTKLKSIMIPASVTSLDPHIFFCCDNLEYAVVVPGSYAETHLQKNGIECRYANISGENHPESEAKVALEKETDTAIIAPDDPIQADPHDFSTDENGILSTYWGSNTDVVLPDYITAIGQFAFGRKLTSLELPESVTVIEDYAFYNCEKLTKINIPSSVTRIGKSAFGYCKGLTEIELPESVTVIEENAFWACEGLTKINIPGNVTRIGERAFGDCKSLTEIELPESVTVIEDYAFKGCKKLTKIHIPGSVKTIGTLNFFGCNESMTIHTPRGSYAEAYAKENYIAVTHEAPPMSIFLEPNPQNEDKNVSEEKPVSLANDIATKTINENACYITNNILSADNNRAGAVAGQAEQNNSEHVRQVKLNAQRSRYDELSINIVLQMQIISQNKALFGIKAKTRKAAQQQLAALQAQLTKEFPNGKP